MFGRHTHKLIFCEQIAEAHDPATAQALLAKYRPS
jgi:hypothetical protein